MQNFKERIPVKKMVRSRGRVALNSSGMNSSNNPSPGSSGRSDEETQRREDVHMTSSMTNRVPPSPSEYGTDMDTVEYGNGMQYPMGMEMGSGEAPVQPTITHPYSDSPLTIQGTAYRAPMKPYHRVTNNLTPGPMSSATSFKVNLWQNKNFDSGVQTMTHSQAPSIMTMTSIHAASHISGVSSMADELARTELTDQQQLKFEHIPFGIRTDYGQAMKAIPQLIELMKDKDEAVLLKAVNIVQNIAKMDAEDSKRPPVINKREVLVALRDVLQQWKHVPKIVRVALGTLFHICNREEALCNVIALMADSNWTLFADLIAHIGTDESGCRKYAILTLHSIVSEQSLGQEAIIKARSFNALKAVVPCLEGETSEKLLPVIVDLIKRLCEKNNEQKTLFLSMGGVPKLLFVLNRYQYENLLWRTTQLLKLFSNYSPESLAGCGAHSILGKKLAHSSQRLVISSLECLRNISDVPCGSDALPLLSSLLQQLGSHDMNVILCSVQIMCNMCANNTVNKEYLVEQNAVRYLVRQLGTVGNGTPEQLEKTHGEILDLLRTLCTGHQLTANAQSLALEFPHIYLDKLVHMRPLLLKKTLQIIVKAASQESNLVRFANTKMCRADGARISFVSQIVSILQVACSQLPDNKEVEKVKVADLIFLSLASLQQLSRSPVMLQEVIYYLQQFPYRYQPTFILLPVFALTQQYVVDEAIRRSALGLISSIVTDQNMARCFGSNGELMGILHQYTGSSEQAIACYARQACHTIVRGGGESHSTMGRQQNCEPLEHQQRIPQQSNPEQYYNQSCSYKESSYEAQKPFYPTRHGYPDVHMNKQSHTPHYGTPHQPSPVQGPSRQEMAPEYYRHPTNAYSGIPTHHSETEMEKREYINASPVGQWPEDLNEVNFGENPFANLFCSGNDVNSPQFSPNNSYTQPDCVPETEMENSNARNWNHCDQYYPPMQPVPTHSMVSHLPMGHHGPGGMAVNYPSQIAQSSSQGSLPSSAKYPRYPDR